MEGRKGVHEVIHSNYAVIAILCTQAYASKNSVPDGAEWIDEKEMQRLSSFSTAPGLLAVVEMKHFDLQNVDSQASVTLCLDGISDPGNLGTLIRTADWFGMNQLVLSPDCTDFYNPKCLSATMGSFSRCKFVYADLPAFLANKTAVGCFLEGLDIDEYLPQPPVCLVIGSESHGIRPEVEMVLSQKLTIPGYGKAESLNAAVAAGIAMEKLSRALRK